MLRISRFIQLLIVLLLTVSSTGFRAAGVTVNFDQSTYTLAPGDSVDLVLSFSGPVPDGLLGYAIKLNFDTDLLIVDQITVPAELDFDFLDPPAFRDSGSNYASINGYVEDGQPAYTGTSFVTFSVTVAAAAADNSYPLVLSLLFPDANNFLDGTGATIDGDLTLGSATLEVVSPPIIMEDLTIAPDGANMLISFTGTPGHEYIVEVSSDLTPLSWSTLETTVAPVDGLVEVSDVKPVPPNKKFYRINDQVVAASASTVISTESTQLETTSEQMVSGSGRTKKSKSPKGGGRAKK